VEDDRLADEERHNVRREGLVGGEEPLDEALVVERAPEDEQLEIGERLGEVRLRQSVHTRLIGGLGAVL
jgi:hypothetical protein